MRAHSFDIDIATDYSVPIAIVVANLDFWLHTNKANNKHFHKGVYWTFNSFKAFTEIFPYYNKEQIRRILRKMKNLNIIKVDNFNRFNYDKTNWYTFTDEFCKDNASRLRYSVGGMSKTTQGMSKTTHRCVENNSPIPDSKQDNKLSIKHQIQEIYFQYFRTRDIIPPIEVDEIYKAIESAIERIGYEKLLRNTKAYIEYTDPKYKKGINKWMSHIENYGSLTTMLTTETTELPKDYLDKIMERRNKQGKN